MNATYQDRTFSDILIEEGLIDPKELSRILGERENALEPLGDLLVRLHVITEKDKARCLGKQVGVPFADLARLELEPTIARLIPHGLALRLRAVPIECSATAVSVA